MALGDKQFSEDYYGSETRDWYVYNDTRPFAKLVEKNAWAYYSDNGIPIDETWGKPWDDSIALWHLDPKCSWATNVSLYIKCQSELARYDLYKTNDTPVPLAMQAVCDDSNSSSQFTRYPKNRMAYDWSVMINQGWSAPICDIDYTAHCLQAAVLGYDRTSHSINGRTLDNLVAFIDADPDNRIVIGLRGYLYRGTTLPRVGFADANDPTRPYSEYIPHPSYTTETYRCVPLCDTLNDWVIPDDATYLQSLIQDGHADWISNRTYTPFQYQYGRFWSETGSSFTDTQNYITVGTFRNRPVSELINGVGSLDTPSHMITGMFYKCSFSVQDFDDVTYQWKTIIIDETTDQELTNGFDLITLPSTRYVRIATYLDIIDQKDSATLGEAMKRAVLHEFAYLGYYFTGTQSDAKNLQLGSTASSATLAKLYLPVFEDGVTTGRYYTGEDIRTAPNADSSSVGDDAFHYDESGEDDEGDWKSVMQHGTIDGGVSYYILTEAQIDALCDWMNSGYEPTDTDEFNKDFKGVNPTDYITCVTYYPFDIGSTGVDFPIVIGPLTTGVNGQFLPYNYGNFINLGSFTFVKKYNDFRDYMTKITVTVPFCGTTELDPRLWMGYTMTVKMAIDYPTGVCTGFIYRGEKVMETLSGTIGVTIPFSAIKAGDYQVAITNLLASHKAAYHQVQSGALGAATGLTMAAVSAATGNLGRAALAFAGGVQSAISLDASVDKMDNIDYNIDHTQPKVADVQGGSPLINCGTDFRVNVFIHRPKMLDSYNSAQYAKTTGHATCSQGILSNFAGFTKCSAINLESVSCTETEATMIRQAALTGFIV